MYEIHSGAFYSYCNPNDPSAHRIGQEWACVTDWDSEMLISPPAPNPVFGRMLNTFLPWLFILHYQIDISKTFVSREKWATKQTSINIGNP